MTFREGACVFMAGALGYPAIEITFRGRTHWSMGVAGGSCMLALYAISDRLKARRLHEKCTVGALAITTVEFLTGLVVNRLFKWNVWDYTKNRGNVLGQVCPAYTCLWFLICIPAYALCGFFRHGFNLTQDFQDGVRRFGGSRRGTLARRGFGFFRKLIANI